MTLSSLGEAGAVVLGVAADGFPKEGGFWIVGVNACLRKFRNLVPEMARALRAFSATILCTCGVVPGWRHLPGPFPSHGNLACSVHPPFFREAGSGPGWSHILTVPQSQWSRLHLNLIESAPWPCTSPRFSHCSTQNPLRQMTPTASAVRWPEQVQRLTPQTHPPPPNVSLITGWAVALVGFCPKLGILSGAPSPKLKSKHASHWLCAGPRRLDRSEIGCDDHRAA